MSGSTSRGIAAILFDKDGTLFDFNATWAVWARGMLETLAAGDDALAVRLADAIGFEPEGPAFRPDSIVIAGTVAEVAARLLPHLPRRSLEDVIAELDAEAARAPQVPAVPLNDCLAALDARGLRLGVATNDSESSARVHLEQAGVLDQFAFIAGYDSGHGAKPGPGQLLAFAAALGVAPEAVAMVGDSLHDMAAARAAGMRAVAVLSGPATADDLRPAADIVLADIGGLGAWIDAGAPADGTETSGRP